MEKTIIINKGGEEIHIDTESRKVVLVVRNGRNYKSARYLNNPYYWGIAEEYFSELEESEEVEESEELEEADEACDLQDKIVNIDESSIGRVVGMRAGKYRIVLSTGKLVELNRNEFYLDNEEPNIQDEEAIERESFNTPVTYDDFIKLPKEERKEIVRARVGEEIDSEYLDMICKFNYRVMVNGKDIYECYFTELGVRIFRYGKHPKQCKIWRELKDHVSKIQVVGTI